MKNLLAILLLSTLAIGTVFANGGPANSMRMQDGPGMMQKNWGQGGSMRFNRWNVRGWQLMSAEEQTAFRAEMRSAKSYDECKTIQTKHRAILEIRAKEKGTTLPQPRRDICAPRN